MQHRLPRRTLLALLCLAAAAVSFAVTGDAPPLPAADAVVTVPGMPPVPDPRDLYSEAGAGKLSAAVADALPRIYVPNVQSNDVYVIDPATMKVVDRFKVGVNPQHVVPSWDLKTLWVANNAEGRTDGSLTPIDPATGKPGRPVVVDGATFLQIDFIATGIGTHGLYPSRDGKKLYVANRGSNKIHGPPRGKGSVSVVDFATRKVDATWPIPGGGSPDMGNVSADGKRLWLAGRYVNVVYAIDTTTGDVTSIPVGREPHGLTVWPQPGRYSLGHTGNMR